MLKARLKNKAFWLTLASTIALTGKVFHLYTVPEDYNVFVDAILTLLTLLGVIIDPSTPGISDNKDI